MIDIGSQIIDIIKYKYKHIKYYTIKLIFESKLKNSPELKSWFNQYGSSQLLYTFLCASLMNSIFYSDNNIMIHNKIFLSKLVKTKFINEPFPNNLNCNYIHPNVKCLPDIQHVTLNSFIRLSKLYSKIAFLTIIINIIKKKPIKLVPTLINIIRSASFLSLYGAIYRMIICYRLDKNDTTIFISYCATILGSFTFQIENHNKRGILNKFLLCMSIHDLTSKLGLDSNNWKYIFIIALLYSIKVRDVKQTLLTLLF